MVLMKEQASWRAVTLQSHADRQGRVGPSRAIARDCQGGQIDYTDCVSCGAPAVALLAALRQKNVLEISQAAS